MPGLDEEVERMQKPLLPPHFRTNFVAEKKAVCIELSRRKSLQKVLVSTVRPNRSLTLSSWSAPTAVSASTIPDSDGLSDVEIVGSILSASSSSLQDRPEPNIEAGRYRKHSRRSTAQRFAAHDSSSTPSSPVSVSEISWCPRSDSPLSLPTSSRSSPVVTSLPVRSRPVSIELSQPPLPHIRTTVSSTSSQHPSTSGTAKKQPSKAHWHTGLHCVEVAAGIAKMASSEAAGLVKAERFVFAFGPDRRYSERTFQDAEA